MSHSFIRHYDIMEFLPQGSEIKWAIHCEHIKIYANDAITFIIPANIMTQIGFILVFRNKATHIIKIKTITHFVLTKVTAPFPQKAVIRIKIPADAIIATTAGRSEYNTSCIISMLLYFRYNFANTVTIIQDGKMHPNVATTAPSTPAILSPTKVAELTAIGPGSSAIL